jgi:hypothetical protein
MIYLIFISMLGFLKLPLTITLKSVAIPQGGYDFLASVVCMCFILFQT